MRLRALQAVPSHYPARLASLSARLASLSARLASLSGRGGSGGSRRPSPVTAPGTAGAGRKAELLCQAVGDAVVQLGIAAL